jgi:hypothetical protein
MAFPLALAPILAGLAKKGLNLVGEAVVAKGKEWVEEKTGVTLGEEMSSEDIMKLEQFQMENHRYLEKIAQDNLTARHQADMSSDSWLSKNIRPLCLLLITLAITVGVYLPEKYVSPENFQALTDMGVWVYGYYFVGRSTFDKGNIKMRLGKVSE